MKLIFVYAGWWNRSWQNLVVSIDNGGDIVICTDDNVYYWQYGQFTVCSMIIYCVRTHHCISTTINFETTEFCQHLLRDQIVPNINFNHISYLIWQCYDHHTVAKVWDSRGENANLNLHAKGQWHTVFFYGKIKANGERNACHIAWGLEICILWNCLVEKLSNIWHDKMIKESGLGWCLLWKDRGNGTSVDWHLLIFMDQISTNSNHKTYFCFRSIVVSGILTICLYFWLQVFVPWQSIDINPDLLLPVFVHERHQPRPDSFIISASQMFDNFNEAVLESHTFANLFVIHFLHFFHEFSDINLAPWCCLFFVVYPVYLVYLINTTCNQHTLIHHA